MTDKAKKARIEWTEEEWEKITSLTAQVLLNEPHESLYSIYERVAQQLPEDRRRVASYDMVSKLTLRIKQWYDANLVRPDVMQGLRSEIDRLKARPSREEILDSISDEEMARRYMARFMKYITPSDILEHFSLDDLASHATTQQIVMLGVNRIFSDADNRQAEVASAIGAMLAHKKKEAVEVHVPASSKIRALKVVLIGFLPAQAAEVEAALQGRCHIVAVDKNRMADQGPTVADVVITWSNFTSHSQRALVRKQLPDALHVDYRGGIKGCIDKIKSFLV